MAYQNTGTKIVIFMIAAMLLSFAALIGLWAVGAIPTTNTPQVVAFTLIQTGH